MKTSIIIILITGCFGFVAAQSANDPTYSVHNYKQPNKAKEAKLTKSEGNQNVAYSDEQSSSSRNYKTFAHSQNESGAVMNEAEIERDSPSVASNGNYKSVFGKKKEIAPSQAPESTPTPVVKHEADRRNR